MKATRFLAFLLAFVLAFSSVGAADVFAVGTLSGNQVTEETLSGNEINSEDVQEPVNEESVLEENPVVEEKPVVLEEEIVVQKEAVQTGTEGEPYVAISVKNVERDSSWIADDETLDVTLTMDNIPNDAVVDIHVGGVITNINGFERLDVFDNTDNQLFTYDPEQEKVTLYGNALAEQVARIGESGFGFNVIVNAADIEEGADPLVNKTWWFEMVTPVIEYDYPCSNPGDDTMLCGDTIHIDKYMYAWGKNKEYPYGEAGNIEIISLEISDQYSYESGNVDYDVISVTDLGDEGWELRGNDFGNAKVIIKYYDWFHGDQEQTYSFEVFSDGGKFELNLEYPNDNNLLLKGQEKEIQTSAKWIGIDGEGNRQEEFIENYTLCFEVDGEDVAQYNGTRINYSIDGKTVKAKALDKYYGSESVTIKADFEYYDNPISWRTTIDMGIADTYFSIETIKKVNNVEVDETIDMDDYIKVYQYKEDWAGPLDVINKLDYELNDRNHRIRINWDENVWEPVGEGKNDPVPELRRISPEYGFITVVPQCTSPIDENGNVLDDWEDYGDFYRRFDFHWLDCSVWIEELSDGNRDWIYTDEVLTYEFNTDNLKAEAGMALDVKLVCWIDDVAYEFAEDGYQLIEENGKYKVELDGAKISADYPGQENLGGFCIQYSVVGKIGQEEFVFYRDSRDIWLKEKSANYDLPNEWVSLLLGDRIDINKNMSVYVENKEHPFGAEMKVEITGIEALRHREYGEYGEDGKRPTGKSIVFLEEQEWGWTLHGEDHGETDFRLTYNDIHGNEQKYEFTASSAGEQIWLQLDTPNDYVVMNPNSKKEVAVKAVRRYIDSKDNQHQEILSVNNLVFRSNGEDKITLEDRLAAYSLSGNNLIVIEMKDNVGGDSWFNIGATVKYKDNDGNEQEQNLDRWLRLRAEDEVYSVELENPDAIDTFVNIGEQLDLSKAAPIVTVQRKGEQKCTLSEDEVYFAVEDWDSNAWTEIPKEESDENEIVLLERTGTWITNLNLVARWRENGDEIGRYSFNFAGIDTEFRHLRGGGHTWVYTDEIGYTLDLNMVHYAKMSDVEVEWTVGEVDENGDFIEDRKASWSKSYDDLENCQYVIDEDTASISLNGSKLAEDFLTETNAGVTVRAIVCSGDKELYQFDTWVELRHPVCRLDGEENSELLYWEGTGWVYEQNTIEAWVENEHFPYGKNVTLYIEDVSLYNHDSENPAYTLYSHRASGYWNIYAERPGGATVIFRLHHGYMGSFEITKDLYATDEMYYFQVFSEKGTNTIHKGESLNLITDFYKYERNDRGEVVETYIPEDQYEISIKPDNEALIKVTSSKTIKASNFYTGGTNVEVTVTFKKENGDIDTREYGFGVEVSDHIMTLTSETYYVEPGTIHDIDKFDLHIVESYFEDGERVEKVYEAEKARFDEVGNYNYFWITWWNQKIAVNNKISRNLPMSNKVYVVAEHDGQQFEGWVNVVVCEHDYKKETMTASDGSVTTYDYCAKCGHEKNYKTFSLSDVSLTFNGSVQKPSVVVLDKNGKALDSKYYSTSYSWGCKNVGTYKVTITFKGEYSGNETLSYEINAKKTIPTVALSKTEYTYNGKTQTPTVTVKDGSTKLTANTDYTVSYSSGRKNVGKYTVKVTLKGNYSGTKSETYNIVPKGTTVSKLTAESKAFTVTWKKQSTQTSGYQIQYSTSSKFTSAKTVTVSGTSTVSKKISKLTGKKKYYVRVRTYKTVSGTKYYSSWSSKKYVTTKK